MSDWRDHLEIHDIRSRALREIMDGIGALILSGNFEELDAIYRSIDVSYANPATLTALIRTPGRVRDKLPNWQWFVETVYVELTRRGLVGDGSELSKLLAVRIL